VSLRLAALWLAVAAAGFAQAGTPEAPPPAAPAPSAPAPGAPAPTPPATNPPEEYREGEFGPAAQALRRGEIILFGSVPLTLFLSYEAYDIYRFFANDRQPQYAPWPARRPDAVAYRDWETAGVLVTAVSLSLSIAVMDFLIGKIRGRRAAKS
jgi:hypothetical protein